MLYQIRKASLSLGGETVLDHIDFQIKHKEKIAVIGKNGAGKTSLLRLIAGDLEPDRDDRLFSDPIWMAGRLSILMLSQSQAALSARTVEEEAAAFARDQAYEEEKQEYYRMFTGLGFSMKDRFRKLSEFSGGERKKIALIRLLLSRPDILLLDEPADNLDMEAVCWLENYLKKYDKAVIFVSHDRYFIDRTADIVYELDGKKLHRYVGNYTAFKDQKKKEMQRQRKEYLARQEEIRRLKDLIERFKHKPRKASMTRAKKKLLARMEPVEKAPDRESFVIREAIKPLHPGSRQVLLAKKLQVGYQKSRPLFTLDLCIRRGQKIGILGPNGSGKSTLLKTLSQRLVPLSGQCRQGLGIEMEYFDQQAGDHLSGKGEDGETVTLLSYFRKAFPLYTDKELRTLLAHYLFFSDDLMKAVDKLSGGEKKRLVLAGILESRPNLLILDEPLNHMDIPAKESLEAALKAYEGTLLFASHDRYFLQSVADSLLVIEEGKIDYYPCDYDNYLTRLEKKRQGEGEGSGAREEENRLLTESLHAVPKKERMQAARFSTDQAYTDWQLGLALKRLKRKEAEIQACLLESGPEETEEGYHVWKEEQAGRYDRLMKEYEGECISWYEKWSEYEKAFSDYRE